MHLPWMSVAGMMPGFPGQDVNRLLTDRAFMPRAFPQMGTNLNVVDVTATSTAPYHADLIECSNSSDITLSLHPAARMRGKVITIKKTGNNTNTIVIDPDSSETIDGETTITLFVRYDFITIYSNGSNWQILSDGRFKHTCKIRRAAAQSIGDSTVVQIQFDTADIDATATMANLGSYRIDIKRAGNYLCDFSSRIFSLDDGELHQVRLHKNNTGGSGADKVGMGYAPANGIAVYNSATTVLALAVGDYIAAAVIQTSGGSLDTSTAALGDMPQLLVQEL